MRGVTSGQVERRREPPEDWAAELLPGLAPDLHDALQRLGEPCAIDRGETLAREGRPFGKVGYLLDGALGMERTLADERRHIIGLLLAGDMFGRLFDGPATCDIVAVAPSRMVFFDRPAFERFVSDTPQVQKLLMLRLLDELDMAREWLLLTSGRKVVERVASFLLVLIRRMTRTASTGDGAERPILLGLPLRRTDLAVYLGTRPESLSRALHELQDEGGIRIVDSVRVEVTCLTALARASGSHQLLGGPPR